ncbi:EBP domain-containing protein [Cyathus striatus]|nr:EBP domain-containing protein [Cyathus striatus]
MSAPAHPYYPLDLKLPTFQENTYATEELIGYWLAFIIIVPILTWVWISSARKASVVDKLTAIWFIICGCIHLFFEEWKEYSKADSRYLTSDPFVVCMETVTAVLWGPLCFYITWGIAYNYASRHVLVALVSLGQIYGNVLYYATTLMEGAPASRPEFLYFWIYFVGLNGVWMIAPNVLLVQAIRRINKAIELTQNLKYVKKVQ